MNNSVFPSVGQSAIISFSSVDQHYLVDSVSVNPNGIDCVLVENLPDPLSVNLEYRDGQWVTYEMHDDGVSRVYFSGSVNVIFE